ncbi:MAG: CPBP family intramembrane metalloprotease [Clostridiales bacterium]|nr:CPBP family intramembrane metalloprotease [Clostridiales bacterium]
MMKKRRISAGYAAVIVSALAMLFFELAKISFSDDETISGIINMVITRGLGSLMFVILVFSLGYRITNPLIKPRGRSLLFILPCLMVVVNNLPIIALASGNAYLAYPPAAVLLFALECLFVGMFEELAFRGVFFLIILEGRRTTKKQIFISTVVSSAVFGGVHLFNLIAGAGPGAVIFQIGYSFLIGGMCAVVLLKTKNIWLCVLLHAVYNFCGTLVPTLGGFKSGGQWDPATIAITALLSVAVAAHIILALVRINPGDIEDIFPSKTEGGASCV